MTPQATPSAPTAWLRTISGHGMFWPVVALLVLLLACGLRSPGFLDITIRDGHLFGQLVDITRNAATPMLLALGMCLVIATGGIDLSVGAVMAISLAVSLEYIDAAADPGVGTAAVAVLTHHVQRE